ncbi:MAG: TIGR02594 family protein [Cyclobacteriaceae bacterium]|nr:TIGR02594 family protein [Cyclobacteriaceae bacterium]
MEKLIQIAAHELGQKEITGEGDNPTIVNYAKEAGFKGIDDDETPWCSIFVNWCAMKAGLNRSNKADARSWLKVGTATEDPVPGDIVVFWRESPESWKGHVAFFLGFNRDKKQVFCLGGNQGNSVSIRAYPAYQVLGYRRLAASTVQGLSDKLLKRGDTGNEVRALQDALTTAGFNCGKVDGDYGFKTETAVKALQAESGHLQVDGTFGKKTQEYLLNKLSQ